MRLSTKPVDASAVLNCAALDKVVDVVGLLAVRIDTDLHIAVLVLQSHNNVLMHRYHVRIACQLSVDPVCLRLKRAHNVHQLADVPSEGVHF